MIHGKWKIPILISLSYGPKRFGEIQRDIDGISPKMLSQELQDLERHRLLTRTVYDSKPVAVEYALTPLGISLDRLLEELMIWGERFRNEILRVKES